MRTALTLLAALLLVVLLADTADAQRRRRRRRRRPPPETTEQTEAAPEGQGDASGGDGAEGAAGTGPASDQDGGADAASEAPADDEAEAPAAPSTEPTSEFDPGPAPPDVEPIRADYVTLMDDLVQARMRVHALGNELFRTRLTVDLQDRTGDRQALARIVIHVDGAPVFQSDGAVEGAGDGREVFSGSLAPGPHVLTLEVEQRARDDDDYRYTLRESFRFMVVRERLNEVTLVLEDDSDMASSVPSGGEGRYEVRTRMRVATRALPSGG